MLLVPPTWAAKRCEVLERVIKKQIKRKQDLTNRKIIIPRKEQVIILKSLCK
jgi:hypothetical protein